jgi:hypothetical protein
MKKNRKAKTSVHSKVRKVSKSSRAAKAKPTVKKQSKKEQPAVQESVHPQGQKAADEVPTLEQVTITCANCGRPFKVFKLKGLSLEGTICQRCSFGETELPESFGG